MASTFLGLNTGKTGLYAYQSALNVTGHNIANAETPGYTRQVQDQRAASPIRVNQSHGMVGSGVDVTGVNQIRNEYYDLKYRQNNTTFGIYETKAQYMNKIENYFNEVSFEGFTTNFDKLYDSLHELSKDPASLTNRTSVLNFAQSFVEYFNSLSTNMQSIQEEANFEIRNTIDQINSLAMQISTTSKQINTLEANGGTANDLRDQRALLVDELSKIANISVKEQPIVDESTVSYYTIYLDGHLLVDTDRHFGLEVVPREVKLNQNDIDGLYDVRWNDGQNFDLGSPFVGGRLGALYELRDGNNQENFSASIKSIDKKSSGPGDPAGTGSIITLSKASIDRIEKLNVPAQGLITINNREYRYESFRVVESADNPDSYEYEFTLTEDLTQPESIATSLIDTNATIGDSIAYKGVPYYMTKLNEFVRTYSKAFNDIHTRGQDLDGNQGDYFFSGNDHFGNMYDLSDPKAYHHLTAENFIVNEEIYYNPSKIAASSDVSQGVEDSDILRELIDLKYDKGMFKQGAPASFLQTLVAEIGIDTNKAANFSKSQQDILTMIDNQRISESGVDINEEAMNLVRYQNAYNLSAKVISVMDEIYDRLINGMGA
jgi:flagellar hook-associated protein 1 FlgK